MTLSPSLDNGTVSVVMKLNTGDAPSTANAATNGDTTTITPRTTVRRVDQSYTSGPVDPTLRSWADRLDQVYVNGVDNNKLHEFSEQLKNEQVIFRLTNIARHGRAGIYDEGGGNRNGVSGVLMIADENGDPIPPQQVYLKYRKYGGKHALIPVHKGAYVIMGLLHHQECPNTEMVCSVRRIVGFKSDVETSSDGSQVKVRKAITEGVADLREVPNYATFITLLQDRLRDQYASSPLYACDYREDYLDAEDVMDQITNPDPDTKTEVHLSLDSLYQAAAASYVGKMDDMGKGEKANMIVSLKLDDDEVIVTVRTAIYDRNTKSSKGRRLLVASCTLQATDQFYYPDKTPSSRNCTPYARIKSVLSKLDHNTASVAFRRMTIPNN